jgi:hypothetical protein
MRAGLLPGLRNPLPAPQTRTGDGFRRHAAALVHVNDGLADFFADVV